MAGPVGSDWKNKTPAQGQSIRGVFLMGGTPQGHGYHNRGFCGQAGLYRGPSFLGGGHGGGPCAGGVDWGGIWADGTFPIWNKPVWVE